jgi:tetratricopeptide (TPR) repeat protein
VVEALRASGETRWLILAMSHLAGAHGEKGDMVRAESVSEEGIALAQQAGDRRGEAIATTNLAYSRTLAGDYAGAEKLLQAALQAFRSINDTYGIAMCSIDLGQLALRRGDVDRAVECLAESIPLSVSIGSVLVSAHMLPTAAAVAFVRGDLASATRLCAVCQTICDDSGFDLDRVTMALLRDTIDEARSTLGDGFEEQWAAGAQLKLEAATELALASID